MSLLGIDRPHRDVAPQGLKLRRQRKEKHRRKLSLDWLEERTLLSTSIPLNSSTWTPIGPAAINQGQTPGNQPVSGRIVGIAPDPTSANTLYIAAAGGGVWKTTDGGVTWKPLTDNQATTTMGAIAVAPSNPNVIYAGTGEPNLAIDSFYGRGILKSTDGGNTWTLEGSTLFDRREVSKIVVSPNDPNTVYAAVESAGVNDQLGNDGVWKSTDGGQTWTNTTSSIGTNSFYTDLAMDPSAPNTLYTAVGFFGEPEAGVYKTTNGGGTWSRAGNFPTSTNNGRTSIAISKSNPSEVVATISSAAPLNFGSLLSVQISTDGGATWKQSGGSPPNFLGFQGWYDNTIAVDPSNAQIIYVAGQFASVDSQGNFVQGILTSRDGGTTWTDLAVGVNGSGPHTDHHALAFDANGKLLNGNDGGIWRLTNSTPGAIQWDDLNGNLQITQFTGVTLTSNPNIAYGGSQDNGTEKFSDNSAWTHVQFGDGGVVHVDPNNPNTVYHTFTGVSFERSDDGGNSWATKVQGLNTGDPSNFYIPFIVDPNTPSRLLLGSNRVYESVNRADTWTPISSPGNNGWTSSAPIDSIAVSKTDPNTIYATAGGDIFMTSNDGSTWTKIDIPGVNDHFKQLAVDPTNAQVAYAVRDVFGGGHVFQTTNGGQNWTDISGDLPDIPATSFIQDVRPKSAAFYLGTDTGVYISTNGGGTWQRFGKGLPNVRISNLDMDVKNNILAAGTYGRGMWEITVTDTIALKLQPFNGTEGQPLINQLVATFQDTAGTDPIGNYTAVIDWGDGITSNASIAPDPVLGGFDVLGTHTYAEEGQFTLTVTVTDADAAKGSKSGSVNVDDAPLTATPGQAIVSSEDASIIGATVASFTDANTLAPLSDFTATIDWGDGTTSSGTITPDGAGGYNVIGDHTFVEGGTSGITVTINDVGGASAQVVTSATISDYPLAATGSTLEIIEGTQTPIILATLTDADPVASPTEYTGTIDWGDGTTTAASFEANGQGGFNVLGTRPLEKGVFNVTISIADAGGSTASASSTVTVDDAPLTPTGVTFTSLEGVTSSPVVATFVDGNALAPESDFTATIDWGDGTTSAGTIVSLGNGNFNIVGENKAYVTEGTYNITVNLSDVDGSTAGPISSQVTVNDAPLAGSGVLPAANEGVSFTGIVATFTDLNTFAQAGDFTASIDWGDGTTSTGTIQNEATGGFDVIGTHTYADVGAPLIVVSIADKDGQTTAALSTATVNDAPLTVTVNNISATETVSFSNALVATLTDSNAAGHLSDFTATINWGDGTSSAGTLVATGGGHFNILGSHTYAESGPFTLSVKVDDIGGSRDTESRVIEVADLNVQIVGGLSPLADSGVSNTDGITNIVQPTFNGVTEPNTTVLVYVRRSDIPTNGPTLVGMGHAGPTGAFSATSLLPLADGTYFVSAQSIDAAGHVGQRWVIMGAPGQHSLVVDTAGPHVMGATFNPATGQVSLTFLDDRAGMGLASLLNPANYSLASNNGSGQTFPLISVVPIPSAAPTLPETVVLTFAGARTSKSSSFAFTMPTAGITDAAGNRLIETFFTPFPQLGNQPPSSVFVAEFDTNGRSIAPATQLIPASARIAATNFTRFARSRVRIRVPR